MPGTDHIKQYSAADIQRYLAGEMPAAEMHALEQAALDDPFLADAIEGMQQTRAQQDATPIDTHLQDIRQQLQERIRKGSSGKAPAIAFRWWKAAAAAVVIVTGSIWAYNTFLQPDNAPRANETLAIVTQEKRPDSAIPTAPDMQRTAPVAEMTDTMTTSSQAIANLDTKSNYAGNKVEKPLPALTLTEPAKDQAAGQFQVAPVTAAEKNLTYKHVNPTAAAKQYNYRVDSLKANNAYSFSTNENQALQQNVLKGYNNSLDKVFKNKPVDYEQIVIARTTRDTTAAGYYTKPREQEMNRSRRELSARQAKKNPDALLSGFISGRVTDQSNNPLSNALLRVDNNRDFFTDQKGQFKIPVNDSIVNVAVGVTGYYTQNLQLQNNTDNNIALNQLGVKAPNPQLNETLAKAAPGVKVESNMAEDKAKSYSIISRTNIPDAAIQPAQPEYGWLEYQQYLEKNKRLPAGTPEAAGKVVVSFQVNKKGTLSDFKIEESLGKIYDEEAIRLIKAGPSWKLTKGRRAKATVVVHF